MKSVIYIFLILLFACCAKSETSKREIIKMITNEAEMIGIDPDLAIAIATVESSLNPKAVGGLNEQGLFQLRPEFHKLTGDIKNNVRVGLKYLFEIKKMKEKTSGDAWFVSYNTGPYKNIKSPTRTIYYKKVMREINNIKTKRYILVAGN